MPIAPEKCYKHALRIIEAIGLILFALCFGHSALFLSKANEETFDLACGIIAFCCLGAAIICVMKHRRLCRRYEEHLRTELRKTSPDKKGDIHEQSL